MNMFLVAGHAHNMVVQYIDKSIEVVNEQLNLEDAVKYIEYAKKTFDFVFVTDEGLAGSYTQTRDSLIGLISYIEERNDYQITFILLTRDFKLNELSKEQYMGTSPKVFVFDYLRMPLFVYNTVCNFLIQQRTPREKFQKKTDDKKNTTKKALSFFERFMQKTKKKDDDVNATDELTKKYSAISKTISRIVAITGHRGSGLTSTAVNIAVTANQRGLSAIVVDMDLIYRSTNLYFGSFYEIAERDKEIGGSLIRCLARPQEYKTTAFNVKDNLWLTTLSYAFNDNRLIEQFYNSNKFISMISALRQRFNLVIIDMPLDLLGSFSNALIHIDTFGLCIPNNLHSVLSTIRNVDAALDNDDRAYLNAKAKVIVTKYNDKARIQGDIFAPIKVCQMLASDLSDSFALEMPLAGYVPYSSEFDEQIESDVPIVNNNREYEKYYANVLLRLMEGAM